jgi:hypothetical protein
MTDEDIHAFTPLRQRLPTQPLPQAQPRRAGWLRVLGLGLGALMLLWLVLLVGGAAALWSLADGGTHGLQVVTGAEDWEPWVVETNRGGLALFLLALAAAGALAAVLMAVPVAVFLALLVAALGVAVALMAVALVVAVALSPLWLLGLLMWLLLRRRTPGAARMAA